MQSNENRINSVIETALKNLNSLIDVNTVIGKPINENSGDYIVPISTVTLGVLCGGGEYGKIGIFDKKNQVPYSAGNGAIISVKPCGFLIKNANNEYKIVSVSTKAYEKLIDKASELIDDMKLDDNN